MKIQSVLVATGLALASAVPAMAQGNDAAYCQALTSKYQSYVAGLSSGKHGEGDQNATANVAIDKCKAGDFSGIPVLEQQLRANRIDLPAHS
jgi:hypothetical protein